MKGKIVKVVVALAALAGAAYFFLLQPGDQTTVTPAVKADAPVRAAIKGFTKALATGKPKVAQSMVDPKFVDTKISKGDLFKILDQKREKFSITVKSVKIDAGKAKVDSIRIEKIAGGKETKEELKGEVWVQDKANKSRWRLFQLAGNDKAFRTLPVTMSEDEEEEDESELSALEKMRREKRVIAMKEGERYNPSGKRDPFRALLDPDRKIGPDDERCDPDRPRDFLEGHDLRALKLSGVISTDTGDTVALVELPDGKGYTVRRGMYLGKNCGIVKEIWPDLIVVTEQILIDPANPGVFKPEDTEIKLRPEEG